MNASSDFVHREPRPIAGILWMVVTGLMFVGVTAVVKHMGDGVPAAQSAFLRYLLGLVFFLPMLPTLHTIRIERRDLGLYGLRGLVHALGVLLWFFSMTRISLAEVTAMNYLAPVYVTLGAALFLGERLRLRRVMAVLVAISGALIILRPGIRELSTGHIAMLFAAVLLAASYLIAKRMTGRASPLVVVGMLSVTVTVFLAPFAWAVWQPISLEQVGWLFLVAFFATAGHYTMTLAFVSAPVGVTQPVTALQLVWAVALGALAFGEPVDPYVVLGGVVIVSAVIFIAVREQAVRRAEALADDPPIVPREGV
ncbi:DMT family transporter [Pararhodobacter sp. SW119]|uniref:DMT family transporter n=1 Tax=Pararhodobacter sp. SW119 TaxID=2780075 RepID=UPI001FD7EEE8|nr:DMT family transporter [Pararhodobacter sp. SW119]